MISSLHRVSILFMHHDLFVRLMAHPARLGLLSVRVYFGHAQATSACAAHDNTVFLPDSLSRVVSRMSSRSRGNSRDNN